MTCKCCCVGKTGQYEMEVSRASEQNALIPILFKAAQNAGWVEQRETQRVMDFFGFRLTQPNLLFYANSHGIGITYQLMFHSSRSQRDSGDEKQLPSLEHHASSSEVQVLSSKLQVLSFKLQVSSSERDQSGFRLGVSPSKPELSSSRLQVYGSVLETPGFKLDALSSELQCFVNHLIIFKEISKKEFTAW